MRLKNSRTMNSKQSLIFRAAQDGIYGKTFSFSQGSITDALFVFPPTQVLPEEYRLELDVSTKEEHRGLGLATLCLSKMLEECMNKGFTVHWDAQNETSKHLAQKFGFEVEEEYSVYYKSE